MSLTVEERSQKSIKKECEYSYEQIKMHEQRIEIIRNICQHPTTFTGNYSYRVGAIFPAEICSDCGKMIKYI